MNYVLIIIAFFLVLLGLVGAIVPGIAGPPFSFLGLLAISFLKETGFPIWFLVVMGIIGVAAFVLDYLVPMWGTKIFGGSKAGARGCLIGTLVGLLLSIIASAFTSFGFIALLLGSFFGAYIGEKIARTPERKAWRAALGSFLGFLIGTVIKTVYALFCILFVLIGLIRFIW